MTQGGTPQPVYVVTDAEIAAGEFSVEAGPAHVVSALDATDRGLSGGLAIPVYPVDAAYVNTHGIRGGLRGTPVVDATAFRAAGDLRRAIPVYATYGTLGSGGTPPTPTPDPIYLKAVSWHAMDEESGIREDSHGDHDLQDRNTVTFSDTIKIQGNSASFNRGSNEYLEALSTDYSTGNVSWFACGWLRTRTVTEIVQQILSKSSTAGANTEYLAYINLAKVGLVLGNGTGTVVGSVASDINLTINNWHFIAVGYKKSTNKLFVQIDTTYKEATLTGTPGTSAQTFAYGGKQTGIMLYGYMDEWLFVKDHEPSTDELTWLRNSGTGRTYTEFYNQYSGA